MRSICFFFVIVFTTNLVAQTEDTREDRPFIVKPDIRLFHRSIRGSWSDGLSLSYGGGVSFEKFLNDRWSVQISALYDLKGTQSEDEISGTIYIQGDTYNGNNILYSQEEDYSYVGLSVGPSVGLNKKRTFVLSVKPYFSYLFSAQGTILVDDQHTYLWQLQELPRFDLGGEIVIERRFSVNSNFVNVGFYFTRSLIPFSESEFFNQYHQTIGIQLSYAFNLK